jgi:hypothetical protein
MLNYTVRMIMGNDTATTKTMVEASTPMVAAREAEMKWPQIPVKIVNVELLGDCCWDVVDCSNERHYCSTCETHLETGGECTNCDFPL